MPSHEIQLTHRRIYIMPTRQGAMFVLLLALMLLGSINYSNNLAYLLTFLLFCVGLVSIIHVYRNMHALGVTVGKCAPVFAGEQARFVLSVRNPKPFDRFEIIFQPRNTPTQSVTSVPKLQTQTVTVPVSTRVRGYLPMPKLKVTSSYPLGLFYAWSWLELSLNCLIYPKPANSTQPLPEHTAPGGKGTAVQVGTDDFIGFRAAQPADPPRHLNWKGYAKGQPLMAKLFGSHMDHHIWLDWAQMQTAGQEQKVALLTKWVLDAERRQVAYGLKLPGTQVAPELGPHHRHQCLQALALFRQG